MWAKLWLAFVVAAIGWTILSVVEVDAQSTVDDSASCESSSLDEAISVIKEEFKDVKNLLGSNQQQNNATTISRKDLEDIKASCSSDKQKNESAISRKDVEDLKAIFSSCQQNNNSAISSKDLEDIKASCSSDQQKNESAISRKDLEDFLTTCSSNQQNNESAIFRKVLEDLKAIFSSYQQNNSAISSKYLEDLKAIFSSYQQNNESAISRKDLEDIKAACTSNQLNNETTTCISKQDLEELKASIQQQSRPPEVSTQDPVSSLSSNCIPLLIQQNINGSNFFNRSWAEFKVGFNDSIGNYWLGNDLLHQLTMNDHYKLRVDLQLRTNLSWDYAEYSSFVVSSEETNYMMQVSGYSGNAGDALSYHDGMMFTTYDRDNDPWISNPGTEKKFKSNCAVRNGGGFWYESCASCSVNTVRGRGDDFRWWSLQFGYLLLQSSRMWLMC